MTDIVELVRQIDRAGDDLEIDVDGHAVRLTHLDRVLWPEVGMTKREYLRYLAGVSVVLLPHLRGRAVTMARFPEGVDGPGWYQAQCRGGPDWLETALVPGRNGRDFRYCRFEGLASLLWAANQGTIEFHPFNWLVDVPERPLALILDLDPGAPAGLTECARLALRLREHLERRGLDALVKTTGSLGLHVFVPDAAEDFITARTLGRELSDWLADAEPDLVTRSTLRNDRRGRVMLDWLQNDPARSTIAPYSLRGTPVPRVSTPVTWEEVADAASARPALLRFGPRDVLDRVALLGDLFVPAQRAFSRT